MDNSNKGKLCVVSILVTKRKDAAGDVNKILTDFGHLIIGRMGIPISRYCKDDCSAIINLVLMCEQGETEGFIKKINEVENCVVKINEFEQSIH